jgi:hypothetical protein
MEPRDHQRARLVTVSVASCGQLYMTDHFHRAELWGFLTSCRQADVTGVRTANCGIALVATTDLANEAHFASCVLKGVTAMSISSYGDQYWTVIILFLPGIEY